MNFFSKAITRLFKQTNLSPCMTGVTSRDGPCQFQSFNPLIDRSCGKNLEISKRRADNQGRRLPGHGN